MMIPSQEVCVSGWGGDRGKISNFFKAMETLTWELAHNFVFASLLKRDILKKRKK